MKKLKLIDKNGTVTKEVSANVMDSPELLREVLNESGSEKRPKWKLIFNQAVCFSKVASALYHEHLKTSDIRKIKAEYLAPYIVNATFSMELYLKAIHQKLDTKSLPKVSDKHNLKNLFFSLSGQAQNDIRKSLQACLVAQGRSSDDIDFGEKIRAIANGYIEWRYLHEKETMKIKDIGGLIPLLNALYNSALDIKWYEKRA